MATDRIHYLDWLKVLIVYGIVVFHVSLIFSLGSWLVVNPDRSLVLSAFAGFCFPWGIPAMFLIAGADAWFGLRSKTVLEFVKGRVKRLLIPMVAALIVLSPFQRFVTSHNPPPPIEQLGGYYLAFFANFRFAFDLQWIATYWLHLWFLGYLFAISVACAPIIAWFRTGTARRLSATLVRIANVRGGMYVIGLPLFASQAVLRPIFPKYQDWADIATYVVVFLCGVLLFSSREFEPAIRRDIHWFLASGIVAIGVIGLILYQSPGHMPPAGGPSAFSVAYALLWGLDVWSWLLAVLYLGLRWLDHGNRFITYARESVLPVYVLHHPIVLLIASFVVTTSFGVWTKFTIVLACTFVVTLVAYEFGVRRWRVARIVFGLKAEVPSLAGVAPASRTSLATSHK